MTKRLVGFLLGTVEMPIVLLLIGGALLVIGLGSDWFISLGVSLLIGTFGVGLGVREGRRQVMRYIAIEQWKAAVATLPQMIETLEDDAPEEVRQLLQARLREAKEGLALESER